jgi:hypothetical protein
VAEPVDKVEIHPALAEALRADRQSLNERFALRLRAGARIDTPAFGQHLQTTVSELIAGVAKVCPERVRAVVSALFDISLDLFAAGLMGPNLRHPHVVDAWRHVLPKATNLLAADPLRVAGCLSNAADHLAASPSGRASEWIELMGKLSPHCACVSGWLDAGKVIAWRAGLVQYRSAALRLARQMPWKLAARCFDNPDDMSESDWSRQLDRLQIDRWFSPVAGKAAEASRPLAIVRVTGGFRGFGGPCLGPPTATANGDRLIVSDGHATWQLLADVFGTLWHRVPTSPTDSGPSRITPNPASSGRGAREDGGRGVGGEGIGVGREGIPSKIEMDSRGGVSWDGIHQQFDQLADANSYACDGQTLAVTLPTSYHVFLVARTSA